ncbi:hypothetical protein [Salinicola socius]|uniref:hypothetical protein n=1 Tax=Salinicola socius TaxID=404433 RepID=UPI001ABF16BA|nr:hypothetical protein [Salinicola socius]
MSRNDPHIVVVMGFHRPIIAQGSNEDQRENTRENISSHDYRRADDAGLAALAARIRASGDAG